VSMSDLIVLYVCSSWLSDRSQRYNLSLFLDETGRVLPLLTFIDFYFSKNTEYKKQKVKRCYIAMISYHLSY
jgi:hypothetical protein